MTFKLGHYRKNGKGQAIDYERIFRKQKEGYTASHSYLSTLADANRPAVTDRVGDEQPPVKANRRTQAEIEEEDWSGV